MSTSEPSVAAASRETINDHAAEFSTLEDVFDEMFGAKEEKKPEHEMEPDAQEGTSSAVPDATKHSNFGPMQGFDQLCEDLNKEDASRKMVLDCGVPPETSLCVIHQLFPENVGEMPVIRHSALLPYCNECCVKERGLPAANLSLPINLCFCATQIVESACWLCTAMDMHTTKMQAVAARSRTVKSSLEKVVFCKCGADVSAQLGEGRPELVRVCACCLAIVTLPFKNFAGETITFRGMTSDAADERQTPAPIRKRSSINTPSIKTQPKRDHQAGTTPYASDSTTPASVNASAQQLDRQGLGILSRSAPPNYAGRGTARRLSQQSSTPSPAQLKMAPNAATSLPLSSLTATNAAKRSNLKRKAVSTPDQPADEDAKDTTHLSDQKSRKFASVASNIDRSLGSSRAPPPRQIDKFDTARFDPRYVFPENLHPAVDTPIPHPPTGPVSGFGYNSAFAAMQPSYNDRPMSAVPVGLRKHALRQRFLATSVNMRPPPAHTPFGRLARLEEMNQRDAVQDVYSREEYDGKLMRRGFDRPVREKTAMFVDQVWDGRVAAAEVYIVAAIALLFRL